MGAEIEKTTSFSRTQIAPIFIRDITQSNPTYVLVEGINTAAFVIEAPFFFGNLQGQEIEIQPNSEYTTTFQGMAYITSLVNAKVDISLSVNNNAIVDLKDFIGVIKIGTPKGETGTLVINNKNNVSVRLYLAIWNLST